MIYSINGQKFDSDFLEHHGILGQKWGIRRFQNKDGSYTEAGKRRRRDESPKSAEVKAGLAKFARKYEYVFKPENVSTGRAKLRRASDQFVRDVLAGELKVEEEDLDSHAYFGIARNENSGLVYIKRDGDYADIATCFPRGLTGSRESDKILQRFQDFLEEKAYRVGPFNKIKYRSEAK